MKKRLHQIALFKQYPLEVQEEWLGKLIQQGSQTEYGKKYHFSSLSNYDAFKQEVPLVDYEDVKPYVERLMAGESQLLWSQETKWFAKSSGTTSSRNKFIPVTKESLEDCHYKGGKDLLALYYERFPNRKLYNGKHLIVGGSAEVLPIAADAYQGDLSAIIVKNLPWWAEIRRTPSREITLMSEWEEKIEKMALSTIHDDVYILAGVPSWTLVLAKKVLEVSGKSNLKEVWPNLELFMHGGVGFEPYRSAFQELIPGNQMNYVETYNASEGFFGIQDTAENEMLLMLDYGIYYEFIPMSDFKGTASTEVHNLETVQLGVNYAMVISTNGGLWRYILGDTIQFTCLLPFRFRITGRTKSFLNLVGEEVMVDNTDRAIAEASKKTQAQVRDYTVGPFMRLSEENVSVASHEWCIEWMTEPNDVERFYLLLDEELRQLNADYDAKRTKDLVLKKPIMHTLKSGTFDTWLRERGKLGGQHKIPRLSATRNFVEQLLYLQDKL